MSARQTLAAVVAAMPGVRTLKSCKSCLKAFTPTSRNQRYCSAACKPTRLLYPDGRRTCPTCGTQFTRTSVAHRHCSVGCRGSESPEYVRRQAVARRPHPAGPGSRPPDLEKRATATALRKEGLTLAAIGGRMGITRQRVHQLLTTARHECPA
ncbi:hypothetical protein J0H58_21510 [bacterium]|nr:hypothetical protein [bacterium]